MKGFSVFFIFYCKREMIVKISLNWMCKNLKIDFLIEIVIFLIEIVELYIYNRDSI